MVNIAINIPDMASPCTVCKHNIMKPGIYCDCCEHRIHNICANLQQQDLIDNQREFGSWCCLHLIFPCNILSTDVMMLHCFCIDERILVELYNYFTLWIILVVSVLETLL